METIDQEAVQSMLNEHNKYFLLGETRDIDFRIAALKKLKNVIKKYEEEIIKALYRDLGKSEFEAYGTEIGFVLDSIGNFIKHLKSWAKTKNVRTPLHQFPSKGYIMYEPYGTVLIIGPFNYPFQLLIEPLIGAIAAGNCAILKPSESTPTVSGLVKKIIEDAFEKEYIRVIEGEKETTSALINSPFDYIFFTGSVPVGRIVMKAAAENLVPVTLELGGKSPVIVDKTANLELAAKRILWGKLINAGQTCIAPDYIFVHKSIKERFIQMLKIEVVNFYGEDASKSSDYGRIVNKRQFDRLATIIENDKNKIIYGGGSNAGALYIEPTIIDKVNWQDDVMKDEIFGPIMPILEYENLDEVIEMINDRPKPLSLYVFTEDKNFETTVLRRISFGGGCINDTISHVASSNMPFGGVGNSGMGSYHGRDSFETFSHRKSILKKSTSMDIKLIFPPYGNRDKLIRKMLK
ncbi:aldehyde dehydrogenase [Clostridium lacusfryxellense]|uniref:aldehyde dehydrogenase n=1 Tax=Clostridium lacusfryxellense TaxID=205328 RepID=UPI001C0DC051|nr:aldehyde dehydrogenase [Clostridium lacusfryxellense]MBU3111589.1 aldehyde dehydrogenase [Clostridium lacusfryxellense]